MTCEEVLTELCERGLQLTRTNTTFRVTPVAALTPELLSELKRYKTELLALHPGGVQSGEDLLDRLRAQALGFVLLT